MVILQKKRILWMFGLILVHPIKVYLSNEKIYNDLQIYI